MFKINILAKNTSLAELADPIIMPLLSPEGLDIICDGAQYTRTYKTQNIANNPFAQKHLNVCVNYRDNYTEASNCGFCSKCLRTQFALESAGALEKFNDVFDVLQYKRIAFKYKCQVVCNAKNNIFDQDNIDFAIVSGNKLPSPIIAYIIFFSTRVKRKVTRVLFKLINHSKTRRY